MYLSEYLHLNGSFNSASEIILKTYQTTEFRNKNLWKCINIGYFTDYSIIIKIKQEIIIANSAEYVTHIFSHHLTYNGKCDSFMEEAIHIHTHRTTDMHMNHIKSQGSVTLSDTQYY